MTPRQTFILAFLAGGLVGFVAARFVRPVFTGGSTSSVPSCTFSLQPIDNLDVANDEGDYIVQFKPVKPDGTTPEPACHFSIGSPTDPTGQPIDTTGHPIDWITMINPNAGRGPQDVHYHLTANCGTQARSGIIPFTGGSRSTTQNFLVTQNPTPYFPNMVGTVPASGGGPSTVQVTAPSTCSW